ncbi:MAG: helix-turn-helix domain-containing protein [Rhizobiales bacterium]|nr:helix-turn-helix domain-containing protein [Hyphomicrobiales bacterium]
MNDGKPCSERFMLYGPDRVFYAGLLGRPRKRTSGALMFYASMRGSLELTVDGQAARTVEAALVPPDTVHSMTSEYPAVACVLVEPETVDRAALDHLARTGDAMCQLVLAERIRSAYRVFFETARKHEITTAEFDAQVFGAPLAQRRLDPRIARVLDEMRAQPGSILPASTCASAANLSVSRFLHLFKEETDVPFRALRAWKRARHLLNFANEAINMAHLALDIGYPDSSHFSHSIRRFYGLKPRAIFSGSRELDIFRSPAAARSGEQA